MEKCIRMEHEEEGRPMKAIEIARRLAKLGETDSACAAYAQTVSVEGAAPEEVMEAAVYIFQSGGDYRVSYTCFCNLYHQGFFREDILEIMTQAFYEPNVKLLKSRYEKNCRLLAKYPFLFRKDFLSFPELPIRFFPYDDDGYVPFFPTEERFGEYINFKNPVVSRNFFHDLEKPVLAHDVYSQYELEYLNDNVRDSRRIGRENHIYLHYTDWRTFCAHLQCLDFRPLLKEQKIVFLIEGEICQYPIDFKARFHIDYCQYPIQPISIQEVQRLIWHTQLSAHNGGDFFNEVFDNHPNLLVRESILWPEFNKYIAEVRENLKKAANEKEFVCSSPHLGKPEILLELYRLKNCTDKDIITARYLSSDIAASGLDHASRIAPALFLQPHFPHISYELYPVGEGRAVLTSNIEDSIHQFSVFRQFKYIKTFTPMRRLTNSCAATVRFMYFMSEYAKPQPNRNVVSDVVTERVLNRSFMVDPGDRLYKDSILVRFEDGKLNSKATFSALAAFLDLPYTTSMTECTEGGKPLAPNGNAVGFDPDRVYRQYEEFANDAERYFIEYFMRDVYKEYGYDFQYYDGQPVDEARAAELIAGFTTINGYIWHTWKKIAAAEIETASVDLTEQVCQEKVAEYIHAFNENRLKAVKTLLQTTAFINKNGQPLRMMPLLKPEPNLLEQPLYH